MRLLVATSNIGKQAEFSEVLKVPGVELVFPQDISEPLSFPEETGTTYLENAELKARASGAATGLPTLADDSGLSVVALNNEPGVNSNRWMDGTDQDKIVSLLKRLNSHDNRDAFFTAVLCLYVPKTDQSFFFEGIHQGSIATKPAGTLGFGYDPIFIPKGETKTYAQLGPAYKHVTSHRAFALDKFRVFLTQNYAKLNAQIYVHSE